MKRIPFLSGGILVTMAVTVSAGCGAGTGPVQATTTASTTTAADTPAIASITTALAKRVAVDQVQTFTTEEKLQGCTNLGIGDPDSNLVSVFEAALV